MMEWITLSSEVKEMLADFRKSGESWDDVIKRLFAELNEAKALEGLEVIEG